MGRRAIRASAAALAAIAVATLIGGCGSGTGPTVVGIGFAFSGFNGVDWDIYTFRGGAAAPLAPAAGDQLNPSLSWDRQQLVFEDRSSGLGQLTMWNTQANALRWVKGTLLDDSDPEISPDGSMIVFVRRDAAGSADLWLCNARGGALVHLTDFAGNELDPTWSADGRAVYFASDAGGQYNIWRVELQGTGLTRITREAGNHRWPTLRSSRDELVYASDADGDWELYYKDARRVGDPPTRLTDNAAQDIEPSWLRTGNRNEIMYTTDAGGGFGLRRQMVDPLGPSNPVVVGVPAIQPAF